MGRAMGLRLLLDVIEHLPDDTQAMQALKPGFNKLTDCEKQTIVIKQHQVPAPPINSALSSIFAAETPMGHWLRFPWGTSILGVFRKP